jgi:hypothetical protein
MNKILALTFVFIIAVGMQIITMVYGWGLKPQNWWVIIGIGIFGQIFMKILGDAVIANKES